MICPLYPQGLNHIECGDQCRIFIALYFATDNGSLQIVGGWLFVPLCHN